VAGRGASPEVIVQVAEEAERIGLDSVWSWERLMRPTVPIALSGPGGPVMQAPEDFATVYDPVETLSYVAARTRRITLGTSVLDALFQSPVLAPPAGHAGPVQRRPARRRDRPGLDGAGVRCRRCLDEAARRWLRGASFGHARGLGRGPLIGSPEQVVADLDRAARLGVEHISWNSDDEPLRQLPLLGQLRRG
jgi:alkanesulfonate monooxygenase SsuD/methylene tetrahydromethanopterin reductase-like flavin-dependent oxidoreductase (luciferase family)